MNDRFGEVVIGRFWPTAPVRVVRHNAAVGVSTEFPMAAIRYWPGTRTVGQKQPVAYVRWADCFRLTTDIGTLIKTVAGR